MSKTIHDLVKEGILTVAKLPKDNELDFATLGDRRLVVIPIDHDYPGKSAAMHNAVFRHYDLPFRTVFMVGDPTNIAQIVDTLRTDAVCVGGGMGSGFKDKAHPYLQRLSGVASIIKAVNVFAKEGRDLTGYNTDGMGFVRSLVAKEEVRGKKIVILGAGGTALPIAYELAQYDPRSLCILNRTVEKARQIADLIPGKVEKSFGGEEQIAKECASADIIINTSNKGADPYKSYSAFAPITDDVNEHLNMARAVVQNISPQTLVADVLLEDETTTLRLARETSLRTLNGLGMVLYQAIPAIKYMTGITVNDSDLERIMRGAL